jgi:hypothetical protein
MAWQADEDSDIQRVTTLATIHLLTQQQIKTIEKVVPWFLKNMPASYFRQVPESFRQDHLRAISAIKDANMDSTLCLVCVRVCMHVTCRCFRRSLHTFSLFTLCSALEFTVSLTRRPSSVLFYSPRNGTRSTLEHD